ncbi:Ig-like domain repeat protein [Nocardioides sp. LML1-1-1.1]|uniref:Ig-like domain repeat protein n=1 Tax=Nocardioides sp. LML1-1-1.1 TaxID=3135248 RepID=UPI003443CFB7
MTNWRPKVGALGVLALVAGTAAAVGTPAHADPAADPATGDVIGWADGVETASYPGPFAQLGDNGLGSNAVGAIRADGTVVIPASLQASAQAVPASVSSQRTLSLSIGGQRTIWAASADGTVTKWGGSRGTIPDQSWTPEQLGGKAIAVTGGLYRAYVIVETAEGAHHAALIAYKPDVVGDAEGVFPIVSGDTGEPVTDLVALGGLNRDPLGTAPTNTMALRSDGSLVALAEPSFTELRPAGDDPVVAFSSQTGTSGTGVAATGTFVTQSGKAYGFRMRIPTGDETAAWVLEAWQDDNFPGVPAGETVKEVNSTGDTSTGSAQFLLTDQGNVVAWTSEPQAGGGEATPVPLPASMAAGGVLDIADGAYALLESEAPPALAVTSEPTISGTAQAGQTLTGTPAGFNDASATVTNQWKADGTAISGATGTTLALTAALVGKSITFESTATRGDETLSSSSGAFGPVLAAPLAVTSVPTITGTVQVGKVLTGKPAAFNDATAVVKNQWKLNGVAITGATGTTLTLPASFQGRSITFVSTATRGSDTLVSSSAARGPVAAAPIVRGYPKPPTLTFNVRPTSKKAGRATVVVARATTARPVPTGTVRVTLTKAGSRKVVTGTLSAGRRTVVLPKLPKGTWRVQVSYLGDRYYLPRNSGLYTLKITR